MLSIVLPALNEEKFLESTFYTIRKQCLKLKIKHEFIIVNDGSIDNTENIIKKIMKKNKNVININNKKNLGIAASFKKALAICNGGKITVFPSDNYSHKILIYNLLKNNSKADLVISYTINTEARTKLRNAFSVFYNFLYNFCFNTHFKYINGSAIYEVKKLKKIKIISNRYSVFSEINIKFAKLGYSVHETWGLMNINRNKSSALSFNNLLTIMIDFIFLFLEIRMFKRKKYNRRFKRII
jgi:glycosyltransferase involved in cell wall biosynthesis